MTLRERGLEEILLHLPAALRDRAEEMASRECLSLNLFLVMAVAEKLQSLQLQHALEYTGREELAASGGSNWADLVH